jgi:hypothetical protein
MGSFAKIYQHVLVLVQIGCFQRADAFGELGSVGERMVGKRK